MAFNVLATAQARQGPVGQCKLIYVNSTTLKLIPFNGNLIKINGQIYQIPAAGLTISNSGLLANSLWYVYATIVSGAVALYISPTTHATSTTPGNAGVETFNGNDGYTLVGMAYTNASIQFVDVAGNRFVRSWFNDEGVTGMASSSGSVSTASGAFIELEAAARSWALLWANEQYVASVTASMFNNTASAYNYVGIAMSFNQGAVSLLGTYAYHQTPAGPLMGTGSQSAEGTTGSDGLFYWSPGGLVSAGTATFTYKSSSFITRRK